MKKILIALACLGSACTSGMAQGLPFTVPAVKEWKPSSGEFLFSSAHKITYADSKLADEAKLCSTVLGNTLQTVAGKGGDIHLQLSGDKKLGEEGYKLRVTRSGVTVSAYTERGVVWGIQTLQQLCRQTDTLPCGVITDRPDYPLRGLMIDVARKYIPLSYLYSLADMMSYYKMNTMHVHLNDNGFRKYFHDNWDETYAAFRLECTTFPGLTAKDGYYGKDEFRQFIKYAASRGVEIIPEFDAPAHSLAFTRYRPSLSCEEYGADHLDLRNPAVIPFLDSLYAEYLGGDDPVFCCPRMHIGTDEYNNKDSSVVELFRGLADHLIRKVESYGKKAVLWGSLTHAKGKTPVKSDNVLMHMWYNGYANPTDMKKEGYHMVSIPDGYVYIVPEAGYYYNYLNCQFLYEHWTPAQIGDQRFEEKDPMIDGGMFAVWNDICGNGISVGDVHHRIYPAVQVIAEKTWHAVNDSTGYAVWNEKRNLLGEGALCNQLGATTLSCSEMKPSTLLSDDLDAQIGYDYQVDFDIEWVDETPGTVLTSNSYSRVFLSDPIGGWLGFTRDGYLFTFQHKGKAGTREHITISGDNESTSLSVDGKLVERLGRDQRYAHDKSTYNIMRTLVFPLQHSGDFKSRVTNFKAVKVQKK